MKTTWSQILKFSHAARQYRSESESNERTKLGYAIKRVSAQLEKLQIQNNQQRQDIEIDNCATDANGIILTEPDGRFKFTKEGLKARNAAVRKLDETEIEIESYFAAELPDELTDFQREAFCGFVIKEAPAVIAAAAA